jgi:hypothetical protein
MNLRALARNSIPRAIVRDGGAVDGFGVDRHECNTIIANEAEVQELFGLRAWADKSAVTMAPHDHVVGGQSGQGFLHGSQAQADSVGNFLFRWQLVTGGPVAISHQVQHRAPQPAVSRLVAGGEAFQCQA